MNTISGLSYYGGSKEPMADIIATGQVSIVDLTDNHTLSCYISANLPRTQVYDQGSKTYRPDWSADPHLVQAPVVFLDQTLYEPGMPGLTIAWKRKEGIGKETGLVSGETVANGTLTVSQNHLERIESGMVTYYLYVTYTDPVMNTVTDVMADITFTEILNGVQGESSVVMSLVAPEGTVFLNGTGSLRLQASVYKGADDIEGQASFIWKAFSGGNWKTIEGAAGDTLIVNGTDVPGMCTFRSEMTFEGKTYLDTITQLDKTDAFQAVIESTNGDALTGDSDTILICHLFQNGLEVDAPLEAHIGELAPARPVDGQRWYRVSPEGAVTLCRYSQSVSRWIALSDTEQSEMKYAWYRVDKDGRPVDEGPWQVGKMVHIGKGMIDGKLTCKVEVDHWGEEEPGC